MKIPAERWHQAIFERHSRRQFSPGPLPNQIVTSLSTIVEQLNTLLTGSRIVFINEDPDQVFKGIVGAYGKVKGAPSYAAFIGKMDDPNVQEKTGYLGEAFILEATAMGLSTCWIGGFFNPESVVKHTKIHAEEQVLCVTPVGFTTTEYSLGEKLISGLAKSKNRKDLRELCVNYQESDLPGWAKSAIEAARVAPSAVNRQPWRFTIDSNTIKVSIDSPKGIGNVSKRLDCGIAMMHLEVGALVSGVKGTWHYLNDPDVAVFTADI